jgi:hypothetical protein
MDFNYWINWLNQNVLQNNTLVSTLVGAGFGSWSGAKLSFWQKQIEDKKKNIAELNALIISLASKLEALVTEIQPKIEELKKIQKKAQGLNFLLYLLNFCLHPDQTDRRLKRFDKIIASVNIFLNEDLSKVKFIADDAPKIYQSLFLTQNKINRLNNLIIDYNNYLDIRSQLTQNSLDSVDKLEQNTNDAIIDTYQVINCLILYGIDYFDDENITKVNLDREIQEIIDKISITVNLKYEYKKRTFIDKNFTIFKRIYNKLTNTGQIATSG